MDERNPSIDPAVKKVAVGIPLKGHTPPKSYHDRMLMAFCMGQKEAEQRMANENPRYEFLWFNVGEIFVPYAREMLAKAALNYGCEYLFMVDDDMLAPFDLFYKLVADDKDIVAPLAFTRNPNHAPVCMILREGFDHSVNKPYAFKENIMSYPRDTLFQCDAVGFGAVLIKRRVLEAMPPNMFLSSSPIGEDIEFCDKARKLGFEVWMDSRVKLGHLGDSVVITEEYSDQWNKLTADEREKKYGQYSYPTLEKAR